ncbi:Uncharacterised protein [Gordonia paraffinivorans]|uniref:Uncharacterized protein n=2 Tax=Gordonia paraffinivorans TaxID=175628 RepID=A0ABD7V3J8_9ACTN|nr:Uncharacterised protein [Gordonia paraffinivorans]
MRRAANLARQKMNQTANIGDPGASVVKVPFTSDATHPAMAVSDTMIVAGGGLADITLAVGGSGSIFGGVRLTLKLNGIDVGSVVTANHSNARSVPVSGVTLADGDQLDVWAARVEIGYVSGAVREASVDVVPAT